MPASELDSVQLVSLPLPHGPDAGGDLEGWQVRRCGGCGKTITHLHVSFWSLRSGCVCLLLTSICHNRSELPRSCIALAYSYVPLLSMPLAQDPQRVRNLRKALSRGEPQHAAACRAAQRAQRAQRDAEAAAVLDFLQRSTALPQERVMGAWRVQNPRLWAKFAAMRCAFTPCQTLHLKPSPPCNTCMSMARPAMLARQGWNV